MNIATTKAAIKTILETVSGIVRVYATAPNSLPPSDIPAAVIYTGPSQYAEYGSTLTGETRTFPIHLYVWPMQEGIPGEVEAMCEPFFARVRDAFPPGQRLGRHTGTLEARLIRDNGVSRLTMLGGAPYLGIEFTLEVME